MLGYRLAPLAALIPLLLCASSRADASGRVIDTDGDLLADEVEAILGTDPNNPDTDGDGIDDGTEVRVVGSDPRVADTDGGGVDDGTEWYIDGTRPVAAPLDDQRDEDGDGLSWYVETVLLGTSDTNPDSDGDGLDDGREDRNRDGVVAGDLNGDGRFSAREETDPAIADTDGDGADDGTELLIAFTDPFVPDTDGDGLLDGEELALRATAACLDPSDDDSDDDAVPDGIELANGTDPCDRDTDADGVPDGVELVDNTDPNDSMSFGLDSDGDGLPDAVELVGWSGGAPTDPFNADSDGDGLSDLFEVLGVRSNVATDPNDPDSDDDGIGDAEELGRWVRGQWSGGTAPTDADTDRDGISDGMELGYTVPGPGTNADRFRPDLDPSTVTDPTNPDTDGDGLRDNREDLNRNGRLDEGETDPTRLDSDDDGFDDRTESSRPCMDTRRDDRDDDPDGDGWTNAQELGRVVLGSPAPTDPCSDDTDGDGIGDAIELAPRSLTQPDDADSDNDGLPDGVEDANRNGVWDDGETRADDPDTDGDGLLDGLEDLDRDGQVGPLETDPLVADSDGDGIEDGLERRVYGTDPTNPDSDGDGLPDGLEVGRLPDADPGSVTDPASADTDGDDLCDGAVAVPDVCEAGEDANANGAVDDGESDPRDAWDPVAPPGQGPTPPIGGGGTPPGRAPEPSPDFKPQPGTTTPTDPTPPITPTPETGSTDRDGDGLTNDVEAELGTDPDNADTDGDGIADGTEAPFGTARDMDGDGIIDALDLDTDEDGWADREEAGDDDLDTPPLDSDGDGLPDYMDTDSDNGGVPDLLEASQGTDPRDPNDDGVGWFYGADVTGGTMCATSGHAPGWGLWVVAALLFVRRRRGTGVTLWLPLLLLLAPTSASAQHRDGTSAEFQANPFALDPAGRTLTTGSAEVMPHRSVRTAATYQWVFRPLVARDTYDRARLWTIVDKRHQLDLSVAVGVFNRWETSVQLPVLLSQTAQQPGWRTPAVGSTGVGDLVWSNKVQIVRLTHPRRAFGIAVEAPVQLPTHTRDVWMGEPGVAATPTALVSGRLGRTELSLAGGVHLQRRVTINNFVDDDSVRGAVALRYEEARTDWSLDVEFVIDHLLGTAPDGDPTRADATAALRRTFGPVEFHMGVGTGMFSRAPGPAMRGFAGLAWLQDRRSDGDGDGIALRDDLCEWVAEDIDGVDDHDGCPDVDASPALVEADPAPVLVNGFIPVDEVAAELASVDATEPMVEEAADEVVEEVVEAPVEQAQASAHDGHDHGLARLSGTAIEISEPIRFGFGTAELAPESDAVLRDVLRLLVLHPEISIRIEGHTDASGPSEVNRRLSEQRAQAVRSWLLERGCCEPATARLEAVGHGEDIPIAANHTAEGRALNRRVELRLARPSDSAPETAARKR